MKNEKTYPFSVQKHAHDIELYRNHLFITRYNMEGGEIPMEQKRYDRICAMMDGPLAELRDMMHSSRDGKVVYLTGKQIALAKKIVAWASESRATALAEAGKFEYIQYC